MSSTTASASTLSPQTEIVKDLVEKAIKNNQVAIFSKSWCPYCTRAKELIKKEYPEAQTVIYELDDLVNGSEIQNFLREKTGQRSVPNIFIGQTHIGGCDDTQALHKKNGITPLLSSSPE